MEEMELVVAEEDNFEYWAKSIKMALFRIVGLSRLWFKEHKLRILQSKKFLQQEMLTLMEEKSP